MATATLRVLTVLFTTALLCSQTHATGSENRPEIIIYTGATSPNYGIKLREIIEKDGRIDADIHVIESSDIFRLMLYFPNVKLAIISASSERNENL